MTHLFLDVSLVWLLELLLSTSFILFFNSSKSSKVVYPILKHSDHDWGMGPSFLFLLFSWKIWRISYETKNKGGEYLNTWSSLSRPKQTLITVVWVCRMQWTHCSYCKQLLQKSYCHLPPVRLADPYPLICLYPYHAPFPCHFLYPSLYPLTFHYPCVSLFHAPCYGVSPCVFYHGYGYDFSS